MMLAVDQQAAEPHHAPEGVLDGLMNLSAGRVGAGLLNALRPEILQRRKHGGGSQRVLSRTAWLDGLRGWAALTVCFVHLAIYTHGELELCHGYEFFPNVFITTPATWPFVRIFFSGGHFAVAIFFHISGYVLTRRLVSLLHDGRRDDFIDSVQSAIFRRPLRIYLPVVWSTLAFAMSWHLFGIATPWPAQQSNIISELGSWLNETLNFLYFFRGEPLYTYYNMHTWTIPVETRGSMLVFVWLFAMHHVPHRPRILAALAAMLYLVVLSPGAWYACFFAGMLTAEMHLLADNSTIQVRLPWDDLLRELRVRPLLRSTLMHVMLVCGLYLAGEPSDDTRSADQVLGRCYGWQTLGQLLPPAYSGGNYRWFWLFWGSWMVLVSVREINWARGLFETSFSQYLGRHSFSLYLVHGPLIGIVSERLFWLAGVYKFPPNADSIAKFGHLFNRWFDAPWWPFSDSGPRGMEPNFLFCAVTSIVVFLYVAELGTKWFDGPSLSIARWTWTKSKRLG